MRRRLELFIPIVMLTVMVQLMAPIAAFRVVAYATIDPLYMASICQETASAADSADVQSAPATSKQTHQNCCAFCGTGAGGAAPLVSPPLIFVALQRQYQRISWLEAAVTLPAVRVGSNAQARAPPSIS
jgi:mono/diheme cytochrome c family protein